MYRLTITDRNGRTEHKSARLAKDALADWRNAAPNAVRVTCSGPSGALTQGDLRDLSDKEASR